MSIIEDVKALLNQGYSGKYICRKLGIRPSQLSGYKSVLSRQNHINEAFLETTNKLTTQEAYIVIPAYEVLRRLNSREIKTLTNLLEKIVEGEEDIAPRIDSPSHVDRNTIIDVVMEYKHRGKPNPEIYQDQRLQGVNDRVIRAYIMQFTKGAYLNRRTRH